jgi:uncharacterized iron-regulated protein
MISKKWSDRMQVRYLQNFVIAAFVIIPSLCIAHPHILDVKEMVEITPGKLIDELREVQVVLVGELHDREEHHLAQLSIIDALDDVDQPLAIGLEMFRRENQIDLDAWTEKKINLKDFKVVYEDNWGMWPVYSPIFLHARNNNIRMVGLNISRKITRKVASSGFQALSDAQKKSLGNVQCIVDLEYENFIRRAMGMHDSNGQQFLFFCEAQLIWDTAIARNIIDFLKLNPEYRMIVLAGSGHAWKQGIPRQLIEQSDITFKVILPEIPGRSGRSDISLSSADYLWLDEGDDSWFFKLRE